jgi:hypothetical protein
MPFGLRLRNAINFHFQLIRHPPNDPACKAL